MFDSLIPQAWVDGVQQMDPGHFWLIAIGLTCVSLVSFYGIFRFVRRMRFIEGTPTSRVRSAAQGYVELDGIGLLMRGTPIVAPLSGLTCTWYSIKIEKKESVSGGRRDRWTTVRSATSDDLFLLRDETGDCVIDPDGAEVTPSISEVWYGDSPSWATGLQRGRTGLFASAQYEYRYTEKRMHPNDPLYAIGQFHTLGGSQELPNTHEEVRQLLAEWKRNQVALHARFDTNNDGVLSVEEWERVRQAAHQEVLKAQRERAVGPVHNLMTRPDDGRPYMLSALPQEELVGRLRLLAGGSLLLFLLAGAAATWMYGVRLLHGG